MNDKNPQYNSAFLQKDLEALQSEAVPESGLNNAIAAMRTAPSRAKNRPSWRLLATVSCLAVVGVFVALQSPTVSAAEVDRLSRAARAQQTRHTRDYRLNDAGELVLANEYWIEGTKQMMVSFNPDGTKTIGGFDGKLNFRGDANGGHFDDTELDRFPIETIQDYLAIPNASVKSVDRGVQEGGLKVDVFAISYGGLLMKLFIDPKTGLPVRRIVEGGSYREENLYDYPADIPDEQFRPSHAESKNWANYPALRKELAARMKEPGVTKQLGGTTITLHAVIVGDKRVVALWSGGAPTDYVQGAAMEVIGLPKGHAPGLETMSVWDRPDPDKPRLMREGKRLFGDAVWYESTAALSGPVTVRIPVWSEDRTRPLISQEGTREPGFHSKLLGKLEFSGIKPIYASDPTRLLWKPSGGARKASAAE